MKKILSIILVAVMATALTLAASAVNNLDRIFVNEVSNKAGATDVKDNDPIEITEGDKMYILGWSNIDGGLLKVVYTVDGGADHECQDNYKDRPDLLNPNNIPSYNDGEHAGFGYNDDEDGRAGAMELLGINELKAGEYEIEIFCVSRTDVRESMKKFNLKVNASGTPADTTGGNTNNQPTNPPTADASVIAIAAVACVALAGVVVAKKVR